MPQRVQDPSEVPPLSTQVATTASRWPWLVGQGGEAMIREPRLT